MTRYERRRAETALALCVLLAIVPACRRPAAHPAPVGRDWPAMGTIMGVSVAAATATNLESVTTIARDLTEAVESQLSTYRPTSDVSRINAAAGDGHWHTVAPHTRAVALAADRYAHLSGGAFDPTVGPLMRVWGFGPGAGTPQAPTPAQLAQAHGLVGYTGVEIGPDGMRLARAGMRLDYGGIAKGYAVDRAWDALRARGYTDFMVNLGGNLRVAGHARPGAPWRVGVRDPFARERVLGVVELREGEALATSGNYERFVVIEGRRVAHIMDPRSGRPCEGLAGVTILGPGAMDADALSTSCFVLGLKEAPALVARRAGVEALFVTDNPAAPAVYATPGFLQRLDAVPAWRARIQPLP